MVVAPSDKVQPSAGHCFEKQHSCLYGALLYVQCITVTMDFTSVPPCMWKERGKPGISYEDLGADLTFI